MLWAALACAVRGWPVLPCEPGTKRPIGRRVPRGLKDATTDAATIRRWWGEVPLANVAIVTGRRSGVIVVDTDSAAAEVAMTKLVAPETLTSKTSRGRHRLNRHDGPAKGRRDALGIKGLDVKADGGYVLVAPSIHPSGEVYRWENDLDSSPAPTWLVEAVKATKRKKFDRRIPDRVMVLLDAPGGDRSRALWHVAVSAASRAWTPDEVVALVRGTKACAKADEKRDPDGWLRADVDRAFAWVAANLPAAGKDFADELLDHALAAEATVWSSPTQRKVLRGHQALAARVGGGTYAASYEQVAIAAGVHKSTAIRRTDELVDAGWITRRSCGKGTLASRWSPAVPASGHSRTPTSLTLAFVGGSGAQMAASGTDVPADHDGSRWRCIGPRWGLLRRLTVDRDTAIADLPAVLVRSPRTVRRWRDELEAWGLVTCTRHTVRLVANWRARLDALAELRGTKGAGQRQRECYAADVLARREARERWAREHDRGAVA
jgi:hypothetical protein